MTSNSNHYPAVTIGMEALEQKLRSHEKDIQSSLNKLKIEITELNERKTDLLDRQEALLEKNCGTDVAPSDMITLSVSGTEMFAGEILSLPSREAALRPSTVVGGRASSYAIHSEEYFWKLTQSPSGRSSSTCILQSFQTKRQM